MAGFARQRRRQGVAPVLRDGRRHGPPSSNHLQGCKGYGWLLALSTGMGVRGRERWQTRRNGGRGAMTKHRRRSSEALGLPARLVAAGSQALCLVYANSLCWRGLPSPTETLCGFDDLLGWCANNGVVV